MAGVSTVKRTDYTNTKEGRYIIMTTLTVYKTEKRLPRFRKRLETGRYEDQVWVEENTPATSQYFFLRFKVEPQKRGQVGE